MAANKENEDYTDKLDVNIQSTDNKYYIVTYSVQNADGSIVSFTCNYVIGDKPEGYVDKSMESSTIEPLDDNTLEDSILDTGM